MAAAKAEGLAVTCEATPHHFTLTDASLRGLTTRCSRSTRRCAPTTTSPRCGPGLAAGTIDCIATDHAPHAPETKEQPFDQAPPGMLGLETALALALTHLDLPIAEVLALLSWRPAAIIGAGDAHGGPIAEGRPANLCVVDPAATWTVDPGALASRSRNTPVRGHGR